MQMRMRIREWYYHELWISEVLGDGCISWGANLDLIKELGSKGQRYELPSPTQPLLSQLSRSWMVIRSGCEIGESESNLKCD